MIQFTYSFCMAMLHSFWQVALLLLLYITVDKLLHKNNAPLAKRNFLYAALAAQLFLFGITFSIYFFDTAVNGKLTNFTQSISGYFSSSKIQLITPWIFSLYIFIIAYKLTKAIYSWYHFKHQYKTGLQKPPVDLKIFTELKAHHLGIKRKVKLWLSSSIHTPITFGFFKPIVLFPVSLLNNISPQQAETLILHELTHIRTNDYLLNWFLLVAETIFFFNPFIIWICKEIRLEREKNCDIAVMAFEYSPAMYAETLLQAERMKQLVPAFQLAAVNRKKQLLQRIRFFTNEKIINQTLRFNIVVPLIGLVLLLMLSTAVIFQSGKTALTISSAAEIKYLPLNNYIISDMEYSKHFISNNKADVNIAERNESQQLLIENKRNIKSETVSDTEPKQAEEIEKPVDINFAYPVATTENDAARRIIVKEEGSGYSSVKVYYLSFENGKWILQPEWVITAKEMIQDSLSLRIDSLKSSLKRYYPSQQ
jgi:beta-lactamase regulating signal transducer with metallopeptidase domain